MQIAADSAAAFIIATRPPVCITNSNNPTKVRVDAGSFVDAAQPVSARAKNRRQNSDGALYSSRADSINLAACNRI
jgi:hypothetical protein